MKVINLGLDNKILDKNSAVARRAKAYGDLVEKYLVVVPGIDEVVNISDKVTAHGIGGHNKWRSLLKIYLFLRRQIKHDKYDLITVQDIYFLAWIAIFLAKKSKIKVEVQIHGLEKFTGLRRRLAKNNLNNADKIRTVSQRMKKYLVDDFGIKEHKIYIAPVALDKEKILSGDTSINLKDRYPDDFIFLTVGRLVPVKNIALQIGCVAGLPEDVRVKLIIVGDGPEKAKLRSLVKNLHVEDRVEFQNWTDNLVGYYRTADCLLLSSDSEGYSMVVAEAVLAGLPVIMTDVGVAGELVVNNENGIVVPIDNAKAFSAAMEKVINNQNLLEEFSSSTARMHDKILSQEELIKLVLDNWRGLL